MFLIPHKSSQTLFVSNTEPRVPLWLGGFYHLDVNSNATSSEVSYLTFYKKVIIPVSSIYLYHTTTFLYKTYYY